MIKTAISVMLLLLLGYWLGLDTPVYACMAAVIVTKENVQASWKQALARILATIVGCFVALAIMHFNIGNEYLHVLVTGIGCVITIYFCVLIKHPDAAALSAIVFLSLALFHVEDKYDFAFLRMAETIAGIVVAIGVNALVMPPRKEEK
jgi:uncharacterized membrane protein YgaE (UPF0421/DUF939 family)